MCCNLIRTFTNFINKVKNGVNASMDLIETKKGNG